MQILGGIASSTRLDDHDQRIDKRVLDTSAEKIRAEYLPLLINHDFSQQVGVVLNARVVELDDGEHVLIHVNGTFENDSEAASFQVGAQTKVWREYESVLDELEEAVHKLELPSDDTAVGDLTEKPTMADLLKIHLDSTDVAPDGSVYLVKRRIVSVGGLDVYVYPQDHEPPHFHVVSKQRKIDARFHLQTVKLLSMKHGTIRQKEVKQVQDFFEKHPDKLEELRNEYDRLK
jgi:hypothetical protein